MAKRPRRNWNPYHFIVTLPDMLYPFRNEVEGQWCRGKRSYERALARAFRKHGAGHYGFRLAFYRFVFHIIGAFIILVGATYAAHYFFGGAVAVAVLLALAMLFITYQEFVLQRRTYKQLWRKGFLDWITWCAPLLWYGFLR